VRVVDGGRERVGAGESGVGQGLAGGRIDDGDLRRSDMPCTVEPEALGGFDVASLQQRFQLVIIGIQIAAILQAARRSRKRKRGKHSRGGSKRTSLLDIAKAEMENPENIDAPPKANRELARPENQPSNFSELSWKELKKLRNDSNSPRALGFLFGMTVNESE